MDYEERRAWERACVDQDEDDTFLAFTLAGTSYRFRPLDTSSGGMGMLVTNDFEEILEKLKVGDKIEMTYCTPENDMRMIFEIRHITQIRKGRYKGHYQVGLSL